jgi:hypothetical protein
MREPWTPPLLIILRMRAMMALIELLEECERE